MPKGGKLDPAIESLVGRILTSARSAGRAELAAWRKPEQDFRKLVARDYVPYLRKSLRFRRLQALTAAARRVWPQFNQEALLAHSAQPGKVAGFQGIATNLDVHFKAAPYRGPEGLALRGFYADPSKSVLKRPLIYVNTAHHQLAVSATFCHEVGHHLSARIVGDRHRGVHFFFDADYAAHLNDPEELAADAIVSIAAYPKALAATLFPAPVGSGFVAHIGSLTGPSFARVRAHFKQRYGFRFPTRVSPIQGLRYLSGMIHYAKLRWALLAEYET